MLIIVRVNIVLLRGFSFVLYGRFWGSIAIRLGSRIGRRLGLCLCLMMRMQKGLRMIEGDLRGLKKGAGYCLRGSMSGLGVVGMSCSIESELWICRSNNQIVGGMQYYDSIILSNSALIYSYSIHNGTNNQFYSIHQISSIKVIHPIYSNFYNII